MFAKTFARPSAKLCLALPLPLVMGMGVGVAQLVVLCGCGQVLPAIEMQQPHAALIGLAPGNGRCAVGRSCRAPTLRILNACNASHCCRRRQLPQSAFHIAAGAHPLSPIPQRVESNYSHCHLLAGHVDIVSFIPFSLSLSTLFPLPSSLCQLFSLAFPFLTLSCDPTPRWIEPLFDNIITESSRCGLKN